MISLALRSRSSRPLRFASLSRALLSVSPVDRKAPEVPKHGSVKGILKSAKHSHEGDGMAIKAVPVSIKTPEPDEARERLDNEERAMYITKVGAVVNATLAVAKGAMGYIVGSMALMADAVNSAGDLLGDAVVFYTVKEARKKATPDRPWGRGKIEPIGALTISALLLTTGAGIGVSSFHSSLETLASMGIHSQLQDTSSVILRYIADAIPVVAHSPLPVNEDSLTLAQMGALSASAISIFAKEFLFRITLKAGMMANSAAVMANAWQHRADASISGAVFIGLVGSCFGYHLLDPLAGLFVSGLIVKHGVVTGLEALKDLSDAPANADETQRLRESCLKVPGILTVENLLARKSGPYLYVECTVGVSGTISASAAHRLAELTRHSLLQRHKGRVANAVVHVYPLGSAGMGESVPSWARDHDHIAKEVSTAVLSLPDITSVSEVQVYYKDDGRIVVKVDVCMNPEMSIRAAHKLAVSAREAIEVVFPNIASVDVDLELDEAIASATLTPSDSTSAATVSPIVEVSTTQPPPPPPPPTA